MTIEQERSVNRLHRFHRLELSIVIPVKAGIHEFKPSRHSGLDPESTLYRRTLDSESSSE